MPPRARRAKSQSISSNPSDSPQINGAMPPPASPRINSPNLTRHRKAPSATTSSTAASAAAALTRDGHLGGGGSAASHHHHHHVHKPGALQFVLVAGLSSLIEAILQSVASQFATGDLGAISKHNEEWTYIISVVAWRWVILSVCWFGSFDAYDVASLTLLLRTPTNILLHFFYLIQPSTLLTMTLSNLISSTLPFLLFRPLIPQHNPKAHPHAPRSLLRNKSILTDPYTTISTSLLSTAIFAVLLELSFQTFLPVWLATYFTPGLRSLEFAHTGTAGLPALLLILLPAGVGCYYYLFSPSTGIHAPLNVLYFDPVISGFLEHVHHNVWGWYTPRQKELISRTIVLGLLVMGETVVESWAEIEGVEMLGALGYAGVWGGSIAVTGLVLEWVGGPSD